VIALVEEGAAVSAAKAEPAKANKPAAKEQESSINGSQNGKPEAEEQSAAKPLAASAKSAAVMPSAQRIMAEQGIAANAVQGSGPGGRVLKEDVQKANAGVRAS